MRSVENTVLFTYLKSEFTLCGHLIYIVFMVDFPDSKVHGANTGPTWGRQGPGGPHVGRMNIAFLFHAVRSFATMPPKCLVSLVNLTNDCSYEQLWHFEYVFSW